MANICSIFGAELGIEDIRAGLLPQALSPQKSLDACDLPVTLLSIRARHGKVLKRSKTEKEKGEDERAENNEETLHQLNRPHLISKSCKIPN